MRYLKELPKQKSLIYKGDWDFLIILDACRYDYFKNLYKSYLPDGSLTKVESEGSNTAQWLIKTFDKPMRDTIYISSTPWVNSKVPVEHEKMGEIVDVRNSFSKIIDVWDFGWENGVVWPKTMVETARVVEEKNSNKNKRKIIHYKQPHCPYLEELETYHGEKYLSHLTNLIELPNGLFNKKNNEKGKKSRNKVGKGVARGRIGKFLKNTFGMEFFTELKEFLRLPSRTTGEVMKRKGVKGLRRLYNENLRRVLRSVAELKEILDGKLVITADHGEFLGDVFYEDLTSRQRRQLNGFRGKNNQNSDKNVKGPLSGHSIVEHPILREVPWCIA